MVFITGDVPVVHGRVAVAARVFVAPESKALTISHAGPLAGPRHALGTVETHTLAGRKLSTANRASLDVTTEVVLLAGLDIAVGTVV